jgi:1,2-diacylglycerol 3-alpha-glucosyltransferase
MNSAEALRVGIFTDDFYPESGGVGRSVQLQLQELSAAGHQATLFAPAVRLRPPAECACQVTPHWRLPATPSYLCSLQTGDGLARRIATEHPELQVAHSQNERGSVFLAAKVAALLDIPHVHTFHSNYAGTHLSSPAVAALNSLTYLDWCGRLLRRLVEAPCSLALASPGKPADEGWLAQRDWRSLARLASAADHVTSPAQFVIDKLIAASHGTLAERATAVPSGVNAVFGRVSRLRSHGPVVRFLSVGRLGPEKRVDVLLDAFAALGRDDAELRIIGTGGSEAALRRHAARIRHGSVRFLGHFTDAELLAQELADADVFVLASHHFDTQGLVLAEAAATRTPILYCDERLRVGTSSANALLTGPSAAELADGMRALADDAPRRAAMSAASARLGVTLSAAAMRDNYLAVYRRAMATRAARR